MINFTGKRSITHTLNIFLLLVLTFPAHAELLLSKRRENTENYFSINSQTYPLESVDSQQEIQKIFKEVLMVYQWPMIATNFFVLPKEEQDRYLGMLEQDHGITLFIQDKLDRDFGKGTYKVSFIPTTIFELAAINSFIYYVNNFNGKPIYSNNKSIFSDHDIRNGTFGSKEFRTVFAEDILSAMRAYQDRPDGDLFAMKKACDRYNLSGAAFRLFLQTSSYIEENIKDIIDDSLDEKNINNIIKKFQDFYDKNQLLFDKNCQEKNQDMTREVPYFSDKDHYALAKGVQLDLAAETKNQFLLLRGTSGFRIHDQPETYIIDSPYRESAEDFAEAIKDWPESLRNKFLSIKITNIPQGQKNTFYPMSLSLGNSLLAGTFYEAAAKGGARVLDYLREQYGYALKFSIADLLKNSDPSLRNKYLISALHPLVALFAKGEYFHSRSKISLFHPQKKLRDYGGIQVPAAAEKEIVELDRKIHVGLIVSKEVDWVTLSSSITQDIAVNATWIKQPPDAKTWLEAQRNFAFFSSFEVSAFKDHFKKFQLVLEGSRIHPARTTLESGQAFLKTEPKPIKMPETEAETQKYQPNIFTDIAMDPKKIQTQLIVDNPHSISFVDLRKRTKEHALVIPKGSYISFPHFVDFAQPEEILDIVKSISETAKKLAINQTGYRIITNHSLYPGSPNNNDAEQEIGHFHIHISGGECLGKPVAGPKRNEPRSSIDMSISHDPFGSDMRPEQFYHYVNSHKIGEREIKIGENEKLRLIAYSIDAEDVAVSKLTGFLILNDKRVSAYSSIDHLAEQGRPEEIIALFEFINDTARYLNIYKSGYRLMANVGNDAGQYPKNIMNIMLAGGNLLGVTVTNMFGNHKIGKKDIAIYDFAQLGEYPHPHCEANAHDTAKLYKKIEGDYGKKISEIKEEQSLDLVSYKNDIQKKLDATNPEGITKIALRRNNLKTLPDLAKFIDLEELNLDNNMLIEIPDSIGNLPNLIKLTVNDNKISLISPHIGNLTKLKILQINNNKLKSLPVTIKNLISLNELDISFNKIKTLPDGFAELKELTIIEVYNNKIESLEPLLKLTKLKKLNINKNKINYISDNIGNMTELEILILSNNQIKKLPNSIGNLKSLDSLNLSNNEIEIIPDSIGNLESLNNLNLSDNKIEIIPDSIGNLAKLKKLYLGNNKLQYLPSSISKLKNKLRSLDLTKNHDFIDESTSDDRIMGKDELIYLFTKEKVSF